VRGRPGTGPSTIIRCRSRLRAQTDPDVDGDVVVPADPAERPLLKDQEQLALHRLAEAPHLVEEEGPRCAASKSPFRLNGAGEGAAYVPEQLALDEFRGMAAQLIGTKGILPGCGRGRAGPTSSFPVSALLPDHHVASVGATRSINSKTPQDRLASTDDPS